LEEQMKDVPKDGKCVICGELTMWACSDCRIDTQTDVWVCNNTGCRDKHEEMCGHAKSL
jgi:predicted RNA-binding Zn-ribbon protein involved in translation (DUF1610 family)